MGDERLDSLLTCTLETFILDQLKNSILPLRTSTEENQNVAPHQDATQENHCDSRILSNFDKGQTVNIPNTICISIKPTKSYGIPGHGPTVGSL
ncbi:unnamed protein product, partial [Rotaria magnacalcarata]